MKRALPWLLLVFAALGLLALLDRSCRATQEIRDWRLKYEGYRAIAEADARFRNEQIAEARAIIAVREGRVVTLEAEAVTLMGHIDSLTHALASAQEPPTTAEQERLPIVVFLRAQVKAHEARFSLAVEALASKDATIAELKGVVVEKDHIIEAVTAQYDAEHALRLNCEQGIALYQKQARTLRLGGKVKTIALAVAGGLVVYSLLK